MFKIRKAMGDLDQGGLLAGVVIHCNPRKSRTQTKILI